MFYKRKLYKGQLVRASALFIRDRYSGYLVVSLINHTWYIYIYLFIGEFQLSFATTATTIVSGGIAERCNFYAYCLFSLVNTVVYCLPAGWLWADHGFLK